MVVTWSTIQKPDTDPLVEYGLRDATVRDNVRTGTTTTFQEESSEHWVQYIHRATMTELIPGQKYWYHVGGSSGWSPLFFFTAMEAGTDWLPHIAVFGDLGNENPVSLVRLQQETQAGLYNAIIHVGDFAYQLDYDNGEMGDFFMDQIEPVAGYVAYMTCPGNHENAGNFYQYRNRFTMPGEKFWHSWDIGPIHFISISTEVYYYPSYGLEQAVEQYNWLQADLAAANKNRGIRPWILMYGHRPMYCSNENTDDCTNAANKVRVGIPEIGGYGLEDLFMEMGVDLCIWAHEHSYERLFPIYNLKVRKGSDETAYVNPKALVHIVTGSAGCKTTHDPFGPEQPDFSAFRTLDYGYTRLRVLSSSQLYLEQVSIDKGGEIVDTLTLVRDKHGPYPLQ